MVNAVEENFKQLLLNGMILDTLRISFKDIQVVDKNTYFKYMETSSIVGITLTFASYGDYVLELTHLLTYNYNIRNIPIENVKYFCVTDNIVLGLRNLKTGKFLNARTYADITKAFNRVK